MNYPLISEYIEAIKSAEDNFEELSCLRPVLGDDGLPVMTSGNFAVVFKMKDVQSGKFYAVKCFTKEQEGRAEAYREIAKELKDVSSPYLVSIRYLEKELFVDTDQTTETEFPVLLMDWVEGKTLDKYLRENLDDKYALEMLAYRFSQLAQWLIPQPFAHGDLKPDNILVCEDGTLVLVDYDGTYVPAMKGQKARELGSPDFRHPQRTENDFDEHIDDFPLTSILLSLKAISLNPHLLEEYGALDRLLLSRNDYLQKFGSMTFKAVQRLDYSNEIVNLLYLIWSSFESSLYIENYVDLKHCLKLEKPTPSNNGWSSLQTACGRTNKLEGIKDENGTIYSKGGERLLRVSAWANFGSYYSVKPETRIICDRAFSDRNNLKYIDIPQSVEKIGAYAFASCRNLLFLRIPEGLDVLRIGMFMNCTSLLCVFIPNSVKFIHDSTFINCVSLQSINIPLGVTSIGDFAFAGCESTKEIDIPNSVTTIGQYAFSGCRGLKRVSLSNGMSKIEFGCFSGCYELEEVIVPKGVRCVGHRAFEYCKKLKKVYLLGSILEIGEEPFAGCESLMSIVVPKGKKMMFENLLPNDKEKIIEIDLEKQDISTEISKENLNDVWTDEYGVIYSNDKHRLLMGTNIEEYTILDDTRVICDNAFENCNNLHTISIPNGVVEIGACAFHDCNNLASIKLPNGIKEIDGYTFSGCTSLVNIVLPQTLTALGYCSFIGCSSIKKIHFPKALKFVSWGSFSDCTSLTEVLIDSPDAIIHDEFNNCNPDLKIIVPESSYNHYKQNINPEQLFWMQKLVDHESDDKDYITEILCNDKGKELFYKSYHQIHNR